MTTMNQQFRDSYLKVINDEDPTPEDFWQASSFLQGLACDADPEVQIGPCNEPLTEEDMKELCDVEAQREWLAEQIEGGYTRFALAGDIILCYDPSGQCWEHQPGFWELQPQVDPTIKQGENN